MANSPVSPHSSRPYGWSLLSELGETATESLSWAAVTDHCQDVSNATTACRIWRGLTPGAEYLIWAVDTAGSGAASANFRMISAATAVGAAYDGTTFPAAILTGPIVSLRGIPAMVYKMPPGHTYLAFRNTSSTALKISIARAI